ncbi:3-hydroxylacyl-ACP dehydratase [Tengunoibacter tsumagoiensis]|uniref:3-hydroxylacyl-ACP dehydratase n=1 Tax=Tengunoibacter tsumagoiensis TaxID=2014871 RepID=A0A402A738_9CHLR|nr:3-hydroxylacyl-ACP dehydratase [Tengunoibacter tsumagoiensis]GCE14918.1 hypothetical protein KTT_47770 [Tengunoibacter tsumagoiensis]
MHFHLIDRISSFEPGHTIRALKLTSRNEDYWNSGETGLLLPQALMLEALCQAGSWLLLLSTGMKKRAALLSIGSVTYLGEVRPGMLLELEGTLLSMTDEMAVLEGKVTQAGETVLEAQDIMCALIDADRLEAREVTEQMKRVLTREGKLV